VLGGDWLFQRHRLMVVYLWMHGFGSCGMVNGDGGELDDRVRGIGMHVSLETREGVSFMTRWLTTDYY
jgi:hypothetical protein